ncbi:MAG TPA: sterol desaturase family protein [Methylomirabilota bacterium]|jgi:sterol desaturase/sphingolipid hydroxylase (fatty acid hydroxylase superfamily)|nr:sterol desaturase family protein [Methylomirabilota bacterium]
MQVFLRFAVFIVMLLSMMAWEYWRPRRTLIRSRRERWATNLSLTALNTILVWSTVGGIAYASAVFALEKEIGILHWASLPSWIAAVVSFFVLDFAIYLQHVMFHAVPVLWRLHRVHHADLGLDATTGLRFHPVEIFLSLGLKVAVILLLGATPWAVLAFEIGLNASSVFNHGNVMLPQRYERRLRWLIVTPDMHRIHHSARVVETNSNFGFSVSWWDRLCGTYRPEPALGQEKMRIGLADYPNPLPLGQLLLLPFRSDAGQYPLTGARSAHT